MIINISLLTFKKVFSVQMVNLLVLPFKMGKKNYKKNINLQQNNDATFFFWQILLKEYCIVLSLKVKKILTCSLIAKKFVIFSESLQATKSKQISNKELNKTLILEKILLDPVIYLT